MDMKAWLCSIEEQQPKPDLYFTKRMTLMYCSEEKKVGEDSINLL
jgi:hypothetical protein